MNNGINHVAVVTRDLEDTTKFFVDYFGFDAGSKTTLKGEWVDQLTGYSNAEAEFIALTPHKVASSGESSGNPTQIAVLHFVNPPSPPATDSQLNVPGYRHIGFVVDDIDEIYKLLKVNWKFLSEPVRVDSMKLITVYLVGPDGIVIQLTQPLK